MARAALFEAAIGGDGRVDSQEGRRFFVTDLSSARGAARGKVAGGDDQKERLAMVVHLAGAQERLVMGRRRAIGPMRPRWC